MKNKYQVLGVAETASAAEIKSAQKKLSLDTHPDRNPGDKQKEAQFKAVQAAYETLSDPAKRSAYDAKLRKDRVRARAILKDAAEKIRVEREAAARAQAAAQARNKWEALLRKAAHAPPLSQPSTPVSVQLSRSTPVSSPSLSNGEKVVAGGLAIGFGLFLAAMLGGSKGGSHWDPSAQRNRDNATGRFRSS